MNRSSIRGAITATVFAAFMGIVLLIHHGATVKAAPSPRIHHCPNIQVQIVPINRGLGAALGHIGRWYRIRDLWSDPCSLQGFPGVELLDRNFHSLPRQVGRGGYIISSTTPERWVVLDPRHDAYFALEYTHIQTGDQPCRTVPYLLITPPNDSLPVVTDSGAIAPCPSEIGVSPVEATPALP